MKKKRLIFNFQNKRFKNLTSLLNKFNNKIFNSNSYNNNNNHIYILLHKKFKQ